FLSFFFRYVGYFLPPSGAAVQDSFYLGLRVVWVPLIGTRLTGASAAVFVIGVWFVWGDRARFDASQRAYLGLAALAFGAAFGAGVLRTSLGLFLGFVYGPDLHGILHPVNVGAAIPLGFTSYWLLFGLCIRQARLPGFITPVAHL